MVKFTVVAVCLEACSPSVGQEAENAGQKQGQRSSSKACSQGPASTSQATPPYVPQPSKQYCQLKTKPLNHVPMGDI